MSSIYFGGSRSLTTPPPVLHQVVAAALSSGCSVHVGCATGADQAVISAALDFGSSSFHLLRVFAAFGPGGAGSWSGSAVSTVAQAAAAGVSVSWLAGGSLSVPLVARLMGRSVAGLVGASAAVFFSPGVGSLKVAGVAVLRGVPVFAFVPGFNSPAPARPRGAAGRWVRSFFHPVALSAYSQGVFPRSGWACWQWQASHKQSSLF